MLTTEELDIIYEWGMTTELPYRMAPTAEGYSNQPIGMCWLKGTGKGFHGVRESLIDDKRVIDILSKMRYYLLQCYVLRRTELPKHRDPPVYHHIDIGEYMYLSSYLLIVSWYGMARRNHGSLEYTQCGMYKT